VVSSTSSTKAPPAWMSREGEWSQKSKDEQAQASGSVERVLVSWLGRLTQGMPEETENEDARDEGHDDDHSSADRTHPRLAGHAC